MQRVLALLARRPASVLTATLVLAALAAITLYDFSARAARLSVDPSVERLLGADDPGLLALERLRRHFGDSDAVFIAADLGEVFTAANLRRVDAATAALRDIPGVRQVYSLATAPNLLAGGEELDLGSFTRQARLDPASVPRLAQDYARNPVYRDTLVSRDGRLAAFVLTLDGVDDTRFRQERFAQRLHATVTDATGGAPVWVTGSPVIQAATTDALLSTLRVILPSVFAIVVVLLFVAFRSLRVTVAGTATIVVALSWMLGGAAWSGLPLNLVTVLAPPLVVTLGLSYAVYLCSEFFSARDRGEGMDQVLRRAGAPILLNVLTSIAGLLALTLSPLPAVQQFAVFAAWGVACLAAAMLLFLPAALALLGCSRSFPELPGQRTAQACAQRLAHFAVKHRSAVIGTGVLVIVVGLWSATRLEAGTDYVGAFAPDAPVRMDFEHVNQAFGGANVLLVALEAVDDEALAQPYVAQAVDRFQTWLRGQPEVGATVSYVDHLKLLNLSLGEGDEADFAVPDSAAAVKQLLAFGASDELRRTLDGRYRNAVVTVRVDADTSAAIGALVTRMEVELARLPPRVVATVTGTPVLATRAVEGVVAGQWLSVVIALAAIWLVLSALFTSWTAGALALVPNLVPVAAYFGLLSITGIGLNPTTSLVACMVLGIAVDDTIHFMARFNEDARRKASEERAVGSALAHVLRPVTLTTIALCLGLLTFVISPLQNQAQFGLLAAATLFLAWVTDITMTPALGSKMRIVTLWDLLRLDLGQSPQYTIPMLAGLSERQARVFALLSRMELAQAGTQIITQDDYARDVYVVIDGELEVWVDRGGERRRLALLGRGATLGETGYFGQRRTASVTALTPARLLRFDSQDLEQLRVRHPRIAAAVFRNLNRIQAERLARMTEMVQ